MKPNAPCKDCEDRHFGCHSECEKYKLWQTERMEKNRKCREEKTKQCRLDDYACKSMTKMKNTKASNRFR